MSTRTRTRRRLGLGTFVVAGLVLTLGLVVLVAPFASSRPDGLERVSRDHDVGAPTRPRRALVDLDGTTGAAGVAGTFVLAGGLTLLLRRTSRASAARSEDPAGDHPAGA